MPSPHLDIFLGQTLSVNWILATAGCDALSTSLHSIGLQTLAAFPSHPQPVLTEAGETLN